MSNSEMMEMFSKAGIISGETFNIINSLHKIKSRFNNSKYKDIYYPDKEWLDNLKGLNRLNPEEVIKETNLNIDELKQEIQDNNLYIKEEEKEKNKTKKGKEKKDYNSFNVWNENYYKKYLYKGKKYKYYNDHMERNNKMKKEGKNENILSQNDTSYHPKTDLIYKKVLTGPRWDKLTDRDLFDLKKLYKNINISADNKNKKIVKKIREKRRNNTRFPNAIRLTHSEKSQNNTDLINKDFTNTNNINTNVTTNYYLHSSLDNKNNKRLILTFNSNKNSLLSSNNTGTKHLSILKSNNILLKQNTNNNKIIKRAYLPGPDFHRYLDLEKVERKKKRLQKVPLAKITLFPNYSTIEEKIKTFVQYQKKNITVIKKPRKYNGLKTSELLYDASKTFDKIYGNKMKAVPKFHKMIARPNDINLPTFMKGLYNRLGLELGGEKTLKMNNFENAKMYKSQSFFGQKKSYRVFRKICYENDIEKDKNKIEKDLDIMKKRFNNIKYIEYD